MEYLLYSDLSRGGVMKKIYAVRKGKHPGIYNTWNECKAQIDGFSGAEYKSFKIKEEALKYIKYKDLSSQNISQNTIEKIDEKNSNWDVRAYVDGSYSDEYLLYSYGCVILVKGKPEIRLNGIGNDDELLKMRNVAGELEGSKKAIEWAYENNYSSIEICYDYKGIELWATDVWKTNKAGTKEYKQFIKKYSEKINIGFLKVKAHSGDKYNEVADMLAKEAIEHQHKKKTIKDKTIHINLNNDLKEMFFSTNVGKIKKKHVEIILDDTVITESRMDKFIKKHWKYTGNKIKDISSYSVKINIKDNEILWNVIDKNNNMYEFKMEDVFNGSIKK